MVVFRSSPFLCDIFVVVFGDLVVEFEIYIYLEIYYWLALKALQVNEKKI